MNLDLSTSAGALGAFAIGLTGSVHCLLMCGPLACAAAPGLEKADRAKGIAAYQLARIAAYTAVGAVAGAVGGGIARSLSLSTRGWLPWVMAAALVASAFELGKHLPAIPGVARAARRLTELGARISPVARAGAMGAATPLLPCGMLYGVIAAAASSGHALGGALVLGAFSFGAIPALLGAQLQSALWSRRRSPALDLVLRRGVPLAAAAVLVVRTLVSANAPRCH